MHMQQGCVCVVCVCVCVCVCECVGVCVHCVWCVHDCVCESKRTWYVDNTHMYSVHACVCVSDTYITHAHIYVCYIYSHNMHKNVILSTKHQYLATIARISSPLREYYCMHIYTPPGKNMT